MPGPGPEGAILQCTMIRSLDWERAYECGEKGSNPGCSGPIPGTPRPRPRTSSTAPIWRGGRPGSASPSICRPRPATIADHALAKGEVGKVGVPISHLGDMVTLFDGLPLGRDEHLDDHQRDGALAAGALHRRGREAGCRARNACRARCRTTSSRNISRAAPISFRRSRRLKLITDVISFAYREVPKWNPTNVCSYHLQEAGATPVQELAYALATAVCGARSA